jgi:hypothetical protein
VHSAVLLLSLAVAQPPEVDQRSIKPDAFTTLVNPNCSHCVDEAKRRADLRDDDRALCWTRGKYDGGAIPMRFFLAPYRVISDTYGTFVYDPDAGYARAFPASLDYRFHGWRNGIMVMKHKDGTLFSCLSGRAFDGPRKGDKLPYWPTVVTDWGWYLKHYPSGVAYQMHEKYKPIDLPKKPDEVSVKTRVKINQDLPDEEMVLGINPPEGKGGPRAVTISMLDKQGRYAAMFADDRVTGSGLIVLWQASTGTAAAYFLRAEKRAAPTDLGVEGKVLNSRDKLDIAVDPKADDAPFVDKKSKSRFDITGRCVKGELKGWTLVPAESVMCKWFAWIIEYPETTLAK